MGLITGTFKHPTLRNVIVEVDSKERGNQREDWQIVSLDTAFSNIQTPGELVELGQWLIKIGTEIPMVFDKNGRKLPKRLQKGGKNV